MNRCALLSFLVAAPVVTYAYYESTAISSDRQESGTDDTWTQCAGITHAIGDGYCDEENNNPSCGYDGGDCCFCTCASAEHTCGDGGYYCLDPSNDDVEDCTPLDEYTSQTQGGSATNRSEELLRLYPDCVGLVLDIGDGHCEPVNNNDLCGYDGGDCCYCTCVPTKHFGCDPHGFECLDPEVSHLESCTEVPAHEMNSTAGPFDLSECNAIHWSWIGDGFCDDVNNIASCAYDGGDCCACTCVSGETYTCGQNGFSCMDPEAEQHSTLCDPSLPVAPSCALDVQQQWEITSSQEAKLFAQGINCSGGTFEATWTGVVVVEEPILVVGNTTVRVEGVGSNAVASGGGSHRIFMVVGGVLHVSNLQFVDGAGRIGGAVVAVDSTVSFTQTSFIGNVASHGGAVFAHDMSNVSWDVETVFVNNSAELSGGAVFATGVGYISWAGRTIFEGNRARNYGGAVHIRSTISVSWDGESTFVDNVAGFGGAVSMGDGVEVQFDGSTKFLRNSAEFGSGGALFIGSTCHVFMAGISNFTGNMAKVNGGAVGSSDSNSKDPDATFSVRGVGDFTSNHAGRDGGGLWIPGGLEVDFKEAELMFFDNHARVSGGAMFLSQVVVGAQFNGAKFWRNAADQDGGAVLSDASGTFKTGDKFLNMTTYNSCEFVNNSALYGSGGSVHTAFGADRFTHSSFVGNVADVGGALRLAGRYALVDDCTFTENSSREGQGAAISRVGPEMDIHSTFFRDNFFQCAPGEFVDTETRNITVRYGVVCSRCSECDSCTVMNITVLPICTVAYEHTKSDGGSTTLEELLVDAGYWRATKRSREILACYTEDACLGGITDSDDYCDPKYTGPYCAVCNAGYAEGIGYQCTKCSGGQSGLAVVVTLGLLAATVVVFIVWYVMCLRTTSIADHKLANRCIKHIPTQRLKIIVVAWQIISQFGSVANVTYPSMYHKFLEGVSFFNFKFDWIFSAACEVNVDFHYRMLIITLGPFAIVALLGVTYVISLIRYRGCAESLLRVRYKHVSMLLWVTILVYSSASSAIFRVFACDSLDDGEDYHEDRLRSDYQISCNTEQHRALVVYAVFMVFVYPIGIPAFYAYLLFRKQDMLLQADQRESNPHLRVTSTLWKPYRAERFYFEIIECFRRMLLVGVVAFIYPNTAAQIAVTIVVALTFAFVGEALAPYDSELDTWLARAAHAIVFFSLYAALLLKVDVSQESHNSQHIFSYLLIAGHVCMVVAVFFETFCMLWSVKQRVGPVWRSEESKGIGNVSSTSRVSVMCEEPPVQGV